MVEYILRKIFNKLPLDIIEIISSYTQIYYINKFIKQELYLNNKIWFKRIICMSIVDLGRNDISYLDWWKIFHYKDYNLLVKFENKKVKELLKNKSIEEINLLHMENLKNCHKRNFFNFSPKSI